MNSPSVIVCREFRGNRLYLTAAPDRTTFVWAADRTKALRLSVTVATRIITDAQAYGDDAFAEDLRGNVIVPRASGAAQPFTDAHQYASRAEQRRHAANVAARANRTACACGEFRLAHSTPECTAQRELSRKDGC